MKKLLLVTCLALATVLLLPAMAGASTPTLKQLAKTVAALQKKVNAQATKITAQGATITSQGAKIAALSTDLAGAQSAISALQKAPVVGVSQTQFDTLATTVTTAQGDIGALKTSVGSLTTKLAADEATLSQHTALFNYAASVIAIAPYVSLDMNAMNGVTGPNIVFKGANVHVMSSTSETDTSGTGNLIVGWATLPTGTLPSPFRSGSNNLMVGDAGNYTSYGGFVAGLQIPRALPVCQRQRRFRQHGERPVQQRRRRLRQRRVRLVLGCDGRQ